MIRTGFNAIKEQTGFIPSKAKLHYSQSTSNFQKPSLISKPNHFSYLNKDMNQLSVGSLTNTGCISARSKNTYDGAPESVLKDLINENVQK